MRGPEEQVAAIISLSTSLGALAAPTANVVIRGGFYLHEVQRGADTGKRMFLRDSFLNTEIALRVNACPSPPRQLFVLSMRSFSFSQILHNRFSPPAGRPSAWGGVGGQCGWTGDFGEHQLFEVASEPPDEHNLDYQAPSAILLLFTGTSPTLHML
jgi:hypothetical protein